ncbi:MAG: hypothetical protein R3E39_05770 [Anaerolineae bacterium]
MPFDLVQLFQEDAQILGDYKTEDTGDFANGVFANDYGNAGEALDLGAAALVHRENGLSPKC